MKKITMTGPRTSAVLDVPDLRLGENQILIRVRYVGVCMSEHYDWATAKQGDAFGHEPMGIVAEIGTQVQGFSVGDRVSGLWGNTLPGAGGMVEFMLADPRVDTVVKLPEGIRDEDLILEPLSCMMSAVSKVKLDMPGSWVAVVGSGFMGCGAISLLKLRGARVVAIDIRETSLENARKFGADEVYLVDEAQGKFIGPDKGFDSVMEWAETQESLDFAIRLTKTCGRLYIGAYHTGGTRSVDVQQLNVKAINCVSVHPREKHLADIGARYASELLACGMWKYRDLPIKVYPRSQFDLAQSELETKYGKFMKSLIDMTWEDGEPYILQAEMALS